MPVKCGHGRHFSPASDALDEVENACWALPVNENSSYSVIRVLMVCGTFIINVVVHCQHGAERRHIERRLRADNLGLIRSFGDSGVCGDGGCKEDARKRMLNRTNLLA